MNGLEILHLIRRDLQRAVVRRETPPIPRPMDVSSWLAIAVLQKAVRRRRECLALSAAATLMRGMRREVLAADRVHCPQRLYRY